VDIMAHVFEQYFSHTEETPLQDRLAESILITMVENSRKVVKNPKDYDTRANIMWCGTMALNGVIGVGKAGDWATHGMEHELSAAYDIAHGAGLAILFPQWMKYVLDSGVPKFKQYAQRVWGVKADGKSDKDMALEGIELTKAFFKEIGAPVSLREVKIDDKRIPEMAQRATRNGPLGSYKSLSTKDVEAIMRASL
jgi:alcohol dehydrogenase YqhD (iron-dependent ADH family)